jgi:tRNA U34 2-thiouridine synthase MnmA/TrmU
VIKINPSNKEVVVGSRKDLNITEFEVNELNWLLDAKDEFEAFVKILDNRRLLKLLDQVIKLLSQFKISDKIYTVGFDLRCKKRSG